MGSDTTVLGKRKRVKKTQEPQLKKSADKVKPDDAAAAERAALEEAQAIFRRHFEAQFVPLQGSEEDAGGPSGRKGRKARAGKESEDEDEGQQGVEDLRSDSEDDDDDDDDDEGEDEDDDWDGLSGEDEDGDDSDDDGSEAGSGPETNNKVEVVDHSKPLAPAVAPQVLMGMTKREMRAYLSSRPPDALAEAGASKAKQLLLLKKDGAGAGDDDGQNEDSKALLAKDLELQRLISESHILSSANPFNTTTSGAAARPFAGGRTRALTTDLRLQGLGGKGSIFAQQRMPMGMRQGITGARAAREERRRREAKENGIILERPAGGDDGGKKNSSKKKKSTFGRRDLPVDMPGMGRMKGGELRLNKRDVRAVEMEGKRMDNGKRKRRRR